MTAHSFIITLRYPYVGIIQIRSVGRRKYLPLSLLSKLPMHSVLYIISLFSITATNMSLIVLVYHTIISCNF